MKLFHALGLAALLLASTAHAEDLAVGDSIAVGTGQALHVRTAARVGASSCAILGLAPGGAFEHVVISAGINDPPGSCIESIRQRYAGAKVVWIVPARTAARAHVIALAAKYGDRSVYYRAGGDNTHPRSYPSVAAAVRHAWGQEFGYAARPSVIKTQAVEPERPVYAPPVPEVTPAFDPRTPRVTSMPARTIWGKIHDFFLPPKVSSIIDEEAARAGVPAELVKRVARVESRGQCSADNGIAQGVMQVRPMTARAMGVTGNLHDCRNSVVAGVRYLKLALKKSHGNWATAAALYNGGLGAARRVTHYSRLVLAAK